MIIKFNQDNLKQRLDKFLTDKLPITRSQIKKLIKNEKILVNNKPATVHRFLKLNDKIKITDNEINKITKVKTIAANPKVKLKIVYEDNDLIILNKPSGILVHPTDQLEPNTLVNGLLAYYPKIKDVGENKLRPGIVHRIDKDVSGLILIAKNQVAFNHYKKQFQNRKIKKFYTALVHGNMTKIADTIDLPMKRSKNAGKMVVRSKEQGGKKAVTKYEIIKKFTNFTLLQVEIITGRTHQIRAHLNAIENPVIGDKLYKQKKVKQSLDLDRIFLHSTILGFTDMQGQYQEFTSELPAKLKKLLNNLK